MSDQRRMYIGIGAILVIAFLVVALPDGKSATRLIGGAIQAAFLAAIGVSLAQLYRRQTDWLGSLPENHRAALYASGAIALLAIVATSRFGDLGFGGILLMILILGVCGGTAFWVWRESRRYVI